MVLLDRLGKRRRNRAELVTHYTIKYARLVMEPGLSSSARPREIPLRPGGITIQDIAQLAEREVYGMTIFSKTTKLMRNSNGVVPYESEPTMMQGTIYIDGKLVDPEDAVKNAGKYGPDLQARMEDEGWSGQVMQTRAAVEAGWKARFKPFGPYDKIVYSKPSTNGS